MKREYLIAISLICISIILVTCVFEIQKRFEENHDVMDTYATITTYDKFYEKKKVEDAINDAFSEIERLGIRYLLSRSLYYSELSGGSFDATIHPLLEL
jgi:thiamine biosynthesis lipoprotein ApbE